MDDRYVGLCSDENVNSTNEGLHELESNTGQFVESRQIGIEGLKSDDFTQMLMQQEKGKRNDNQEDASKNRMDKASPVFDDVWTSHLFYTPAQDAQRFWG